MTNTLEIKIGDTVKIYQKGRSPFTGIVIARHGGASPSATFCVRAILDGIGVEKIYPLHSPLINKIEILKRAKVRRAKLYYLRKIVGKIKLKELRPKSVQETKKETKEKAKAKKAKTVKAPARSKTRSRKRTKK